MKNTLKQLGMDKDDPRFITAATELKSRSKKKLGEILLIIFLLAIGVTFFILFILIIPTFINAYMTTNSVKDYIFITISMIIAIPLLGICSYACIGMGIYGLVEKPKWYLGLYTDQLIFKKHNESTKKYDENIYPISSVKKCIILKTEHVNFISIKGRARESVHYTISVHIECKVDNENEYIHIIRPDGFKELNEIIMFLQDVQHIPIYYSFAPGEKYDYRKRDERKLIKEFAWKPHSFNGALEDFSQREFTRRVNRFEALERSNKHLQNKK